MAAVRPKGSPLIVARDQLLQRGCRPPVVTDEWWLDVVEASNREPCAGFFSQRRHWGRWTFPLPPDGGNPTERGERLARTALQMAWEEAADAERISQVTPPNVVLDFVNQHPGLAEVCHNYPGYLASYAPQLTIRGLGGDFEDDFDLLLSASMTRYNELRAKKDRFGSVLSTDGLPPGCDEKIALRHPNLGYYKPSLLACQFVQGEMGGPPVKAFEVVDYVFWFLSAASAWIPVNVRQALTDGTKEWHSWLWCDHVSEVERQLGIDPHEHRGALHHALSRARSLATFRPSAKVRADLVGRATISVTVLGLPESPSALAERFLAEGYIETYLRARKRTK